MQETEVKQKIAAVSANLENSYWGYVQTREFMELVSQLEEAKKKTITKTLICNTGKGKTYAVKKFRNSFPGHTWVVTINSIMKLGDIINALLGMLGLPEKGSRAARISSVVQHIKELRRNGHRPMLVLDEGENMTNETMRMLKGLYDGICEDGHASIVLIGTGQLLKKMERSHRRDSDAGPQFYRRFKAGIRVIREVPVEKAFTLFFEKFGVADKGLRRLLCELCGNYGELNAYLEPALREADERGEELTEAFFRVMYNMPR